MACLKKRTGNFGKTSIILKAGMEKIIKLFNLFFTPEKSGSIASQKPPNKNSKNLTPSFQNSQNSLTRSQDNKTSPHSFSQTLNPIDKPILFSNSPSIKRKPPSQNMDSVNQIQSIADPSSSNSSPFKKNPIAYNFMDEKLKFIERYLG